MNIKKPLHQWGGTTAIVFSGAHFSHDICFGLLPALLPLIRDNLGLNYFQSGLLLSAFMITSGVSQFLGGWLADRLSQPILASIGLGGIGLAAVAVGLSSSYYQMVAILIIMGVLAGFYHPSATSMISSRCETAMRGKAIAFHIVGGSTGFTIGPVLGGPIADALGWRLAYILLSIPALVSMVVVLRKFGLRESSLADPKVTEKQTGVSKADPASVSHGNIRDFIRSVVLVTALSTVTLLVAGLALAFFPIYLVDRYHIEPAHAMMLLGLVRGGGIVGNLFGGWLSDRWGRGKTIFLALVMVGPILYVLSRLSFNNWLIAVFLLFGFVVQMREVTIQSLLMDEAPPHLRATIFGIYFGLGQEGISLLQPVVGYYMDQLGIVYVFQMVAVVSAGLSVVSLLLLTRQHLFRSNRTNAFT